MILSSKGVRGSPAQILASCRLSELQRGNGAFTCVFTPLSSPPCFARFNCFPHLQASSSYHQSRSSEAQFAAACPMDSNVFLLQQLKYFRAHVWKCAPAETALVRFSIGMCSVSKLKFTIYASMLCDPGKIIRSPAIRSVCGIVKGHAIRSGSQVATVRRRRNLALLAEVSPPAASVWIFLMAAMPMARSW